MTTREEIVSAIQSVDERLAALRARILADPERALLEGTWRVRDVLSHLAARSNGVDRIVQRVQAAASGARTQAPASIDDINAGQVEERRELDAETLMDEIRAGHAAAIAALAHVDDGTLARVIPLGFRPGEVEVADLMVRGGPGHDHMHLDQVEAALGA